MLLSYARRQRMDPDHPDRVADVWRKENLRTDARRW